MLLVGTEQLTDHAPQPNAMSLMRTTHELMCPTIAVEYAVYFHTSIDAFHLVTTDARVCYLPYKDQSLANACV